jgi:mannan endo-1,4-beta-mannosidase
VKTRYLIGVMVILAAGILEYGLVSLVNLTGSTPAAGSVPVTASSAVAAYDVASLITPAQTHKYLGVTIKGAPTSMTPIKSFAQAIGKKPNIIELYESFEDNFDASGVRTVYQYGSLPLISWEPFTVKLASIAAGSQDKYLKAYAKAVRTLNLPVAITFAHEMNGNWYPWGRQAATAADFVTAWRHIHNVFVAAGATNVIWVWTPNVINPAPQVPLPSVYPGDKYVDWIGMDGYFTHRGQVTFATLFGPTITAVRKFTNKPMLIVETAAEPGTSRPDEIADLYDGVANTPGLLGFVWFDNRGSANWRINDDRSAVTAFKNGAKAPEFGFAVNG